MGALVADWSHWQAPGGQQPDWERIADEVAAGEVAALIFKATENMAEDPAFAAFRQNAEDRKIRWLAFPFLRPGDTQATIEHFVEVVGRGTIAALDWEAVGVSAADVHQWQDICESELGRSGLVYRGKWPPAQVTPRILEWLHWYAEYPADPNAAPRMPPLDGSEGAPPGRGWFLWQYTGSGRLGGLATATDLSRLACPLDVFNHWYDTGELLPWTRPETPVVPGIAAPRKLWLGSSGPDVVQLQQKLAKSGYPNVADDGEFGPITKSALLAYETTHHLTVGPIALDQL